MIIMNANYRMFKNGNEEVMPAPVDKDTPNVPWWYDKVAAMAQSLKQVGFTHVLLPPFCKSQSGAAPDADGYGKFDDYDLGSKNQMFSIPTRFGTREQLQRCVAILHANGLAALGDIVMHQYDGGNNGVYQYTASGGPKVGRFPKTASCFVGNPPRVQIDDVWNSEGDFAFGDMVATEHCVPAGYMGNGLISSANWLIRATSIDGMRIDDVKGMYAQFIGQFISETPGWKFSELFDGNPDNLEAWVWYYAINGRSSVLDFTFHWAMQAMCDFGVPMTQMNGAGYAARDPYHAVTFVDSPDTDTSPGENVIFNKLLAYAFMLTIEGVPLVYYKDYSTDPNCYGLKPWIDTLVWINNTLASGGTETRYVDDEVIVLNRLGGPGLLTAINKDTWNKRTITCYTSFGPNQQLHDYTGRHEDIWTDGNGFATFTIPSNAYGGGQSYLCFSRPEYQGKQPQLPSVTTTQEFEGAADLDIPAVPPNFTMKVGRVWCKKGSPLVLLEVDKATSLTFKVTGPDNVGVPLTNGVGKVTAEGWQTITVTSASVASTPTPFTLRVSYDATEVLA